MIASTRRASLLTILVVASWSAVTTAQTPPSKLSGIAKVATPLIDANLEGCSASESGLTDDRLQTIIELRLRTAGLRILTVAEDRADPDINPFVHLTLICVPVSSSETGVQWGFAFSTQLSVQIYQRALINGSIAPTELWENTYLNVAGNKTLRAEVERVVGQLLDELINQWLAANPRRQ